MTDDVGRIAEALRRLSEDGVDDGFLILHADHDRNYYVQLCRTRDAGTLQAEAVSNAYLDPPHRLSAQQEARLLALGWKRPEPGDSENFWREVQARDDADRRGIAQEILRTLNEVYALPAGRSIEVELSLG